VEVHIRDLDRDWEPLVPVYQRYNENDAWDTSVIEKVEVEVGDKDSQDSKNRTFAALDVEQVPVFEIVIVMPGQLVIVIEVEPSLSLPHLREG
jgi:hypothetical protein